MRATPRLRSMKHPASRAGIPQALARERAARILDLHYRLDCRIDARASRIEGVQEIHFSLLQSPGKNALVLDWRPQLPAAEITRTVRSLQVNGRSHARSRFIRGQ